jgi:hypothetical protein
VRLQTPTELLLRDYPLGIDSIGRTTEFIRGNKYRITRYFMADVPSFQMEPLMSSHKDYLRRMVYSLTPGAGDLFQPSSDPEKTWLSYGDRLRYALDEDFKKPIAGTEGLIDSANKLNTNTEKIAFVYSSLRKRFARKNEQTLKPESGGLEEAWKTQSANSAELNLLLLYLLRKSGVESYPLLISTRENGHVNRKYPSISQFNGIDVLALDSTQFFLLDASIPYQSYLNPPLNVLNREGLVLSDNVQWVGISDSRYLQRTSTAVFAAINIDDKLEGVVDGRYFDYSKSYRLDSTLKEDEDEELEKKPIGLEIISVKEENRDAEGEPLIERTEFKYEMNNTGDFYFIRPGFLSKDNKNPFTQEKRTTDIDLGCNQQHIFSLNLDVPEGWEVESFPNNKIIRAPDSSFFYRRVVEKSGNRLYYNYTFEINRALFNSDEYDGVRQFFNLVYSAIEEEIVLKKKKK